MRTVTCSVDLAKNVFHFFGIDEDGNIIKKRLKRSQMLTFFTQLTSCLIGMEACRGAHYWARELGKQRHTVQVIAPQKVKPYVQGHKTDANDTEGIHEAIKS